MPVFKINKTEDYSIISNKFLKEEKMSLKAKGLLAVMLSLPEKWVYSIDGLVSICKEEESAIKSTLKLLHRSSQIIMTARYKLSRQLFLHLMRQNGFLCHQS